MAKNKASKFILFESSEARRKTLASQFTLGILGIGTGRQGSGESDGGGLVRILFGVMARRVADLQTMPAVLAGF